MMHRPILTLVFGVVLTFGFRVSGASAEQLIQQINPPSQGFYAKYLDCYGIPVLSSAAVDNRALQLACDKMVLMLHNIPQAHQNLFQNNVEFHIIGSNEQTTDLPEYRDKRGTMYTDKQGKTEPFDQRIRGRGGRQVACAEEKLLNLPNDRFRGSGDVCIHEFAHVIMDLGFTSEQREAIQEQYRKSIGAGRWAGAYAAVDAHEYWAELSVWYFSQHGNRRMQGAPPGDGRQGLYAYDPEGYALLNRLYSGSD
jgi:hypothetical protein